MAVLCMRSASGPNYRNSSIIVDMAVGQILHSTECISSLDKNRFVPLLCVVELLSNVTAVHFTMMSKLRDSFPWRVELVFEMPSLSTQTRVRKGRATVHVCHEMGVGVGRARCHRWSRIRYRQYDAHGRRYSVYDVTVATATSWPYCYQTSCRCQNHAFSLFSMVYVPHRALVFRGPSGREAKAGAALTISGHGAVFFINLLRNVN